MPTRKIPKPHLSNLDFSPLINWFRKNRRSLPWRENANPYSVLISEVMLQQTQVNTVIPYFNNFILKFPDLNALSKATEQDVLSAWQGLGYYRRAKNLHQLSKTVSELPNTSAVLKSLPGIGEYTSGAIASIAFGERVACIDGNVERVYSRLTCDASTKQLLIQNAKKFVEDSFSETKGSPGELNEALMELGATICRPADPKCDSCPMSNQCKSHTSKRVSEFPLKQAGSKLTPLTHVCVVPLNGERTGIQQIPEGRWWGGMWQFPRMEKERSRSIHSCIEDLGFIQTSPFLRHKHSVTRFSITLNVFISNEIPNSLTKTSLGELENLPMPAPQRHITKALLTRFC